MGVYLQIVNRQRVEELLQYFTMNYVEVALVHNDTVSPRLGN